MILYIVKPSQINLKLISGKLITLKIKIIYAYIWTEIYKYIHTVYTYILAYFQIDII